jgi:hypothetical protein
MILRSSRISSSQRSLLSNSYGLSDLTKTANFRWSALISLSFRPAVSEWSDSSLNSAEYVFSVQFASSDNVGSSPDFGASTSFVRSVAALFSPGFPPLENTTFVKCSTIAPCGSGFLADSGAFNASESISPSSTFSSAETVVSATLPPKAGTFSHSQQFPVTTIPRGSVPFQASQLPVSPGGDAQAVKTTSWLVSVIASVIALLLILVIAWVIWRRLTRIPPVPREPEVTMETEPGGEAEFENPLEYDSLPGDDAQLDRAFGILSESSESAALRHSCDK